MLACSLSRIGQSQIGPGTMLQELRQKTDPEGFTDPNLTQSFIHDIIPWGLFTTSSHRTQLSKVKHLFLHLLCVYLLMSESEVCTHFLTEVVVNIYTILISNAQGAKKKAETFQKEKKKLNIPLP